MDPQTNQNQGVSTALPTPGVDQASAGAIGAASGTEIPVVAPPLAPLPGATSGAPAGQAPASAGSPADSVAAGDDAAVDRATNAILAQLPVEAADSDVIEPEWVNRVKQTAAETSQDPYKQVMELNKLRTEYMKKRYNKDIRLTDV